MDKIYYLGFYDTVDNKEENRNFALSAVNKMTYIIEAIEENGYSVEVISTSQTKNKQGYEGKCVPIGKNSFLRLFKTLPWGHKLKRVISIMNMRWQYRRYILKTLKTGDTLIAYHSVPYAAFLAWAKRKIGFRLILEVEEIYADVTGRGSDRKKEYKAFSTADAYIFPTELLNKKLNTQGKPYTVIHGTYRVEPDRGVRFNDGKIHIVYTGTLDPRKGGTAAVAAGKFLNSNYHIHILGFGGQKEKNNLLKEIDRVRKVSECTVTYDGVLSGEEYIRFLQSCDIGLSPQNPVAEFNDTSFPSKILSYMANGLRVVSIRIPAIESSAVGKYMYYYDRQIPEEIAQTIKLIKKDAYDSKNILKALNENFTYNIGNLIGRKSEIKKLVSINLGNGGSTGKIMQDISRIACNSGYVAYVAYPAYPWERTLNFPHQILIGRSFTNKWAGRFKRYFGVDLGNAFFSTIRFICKLREIKPDILHLHNLHGDYISVSLLFNYIRKKNIRVVWTLHDCWAFTGHCPHFEIIKCDKWKTGCYKCPQYKEYPQSKFDNSKLMYKLKKKWFTCVKDLTIVTPSNWLAGLVKQSFLKDYPIKVIHNGIDLSVFKPTASNFRRKYNCEDKIVLLGVAFGWGTRKGLDIFIELANHIDDRYQIVLVGTDDNIDKQLPSNIISIHRTQDQTELAEIYTAADLFINPTREEVLGLVNIEALACGCPVITFNTGGSPECIDETCGKIISGNCVEDILFAIDYTCPKGNCINRAALFDKDKKFMEYINLYNAGSIIDDKEQVY